MFPRQRHAFLLGGLPPRRYRYSCHLRYWPYTLPRPSNDNFRLLKRLVVMHFRHLRKAAAVIVRLVAQLRAA
jgi:hypothetical protein